MERKLSKLVGLVLAGLLLAVSVGSPDARGACPNDAVRIGPSAQLPDCRAYELISPADSKGRLLESLAGLHFDDFFPTDPITASGESAIYAAAETPLPEVSEPNGSVDVYRSQRTPEGWRVAGRLSAPGSLGILPDPGGVSSDHRYNFLHVLPDGGGILPGEFEGGADYLRGPDGSFELVGQGSMGEERLAQGRYISPNGEHIIFTTGKSFLQSVWCSGYASCKAARLEPEAAPTGIGAIYDRGPDGPTRVVSLLPGNVPTVANAFYEGNSKSGSTVAFKIEGTLYVRLVEDDKTEKVTEEDATFAGLSDDGRYLFYLVGGNIFRFDTATQNKEQINSSGDGEIVNVSADGSHVYLISKSQLDGPEGIAGEPNMYVWGQGALDFIATVLPSDLERTSGSAPDLPSLTNWTDLVVAPRRPELAELIGPGADSSRTTPDGHIIAFESRAKLTSYENAGHTEIYRYDDRTQDMTCVSCSQLSSIAAVDARFEDVEFVHAPIVVNNLSTDGGRVFFETAEPLVPDDVDAINDIYEWREGDNQPQALISSGQSILYPPLQETSFLPKPNTLLGITPSGSDVMFSASEQLVSAAGSGGTQGIYDARVGGGFPEPLPASECGGEDCRSPASGSGPPLTEPASRAVRRHGNVSPRKRGCRQRRRHGRKVRRCRHHHHQKRRDSHSARSSAATGSSTGDGSGPAVGITGSSTGSTSTASGVQAQSSAVALAGAVDPAEEFGIESVAASASTSSAAAHPDFTTRFVLNSHLESGRAVSAGRTEGVSVTLPQGLVGDPTAVPQCKTGEFVGFGHCSFESQVGVAEVELSGNLAGEVLTEPIYNLEPPHPDREVARFGFIAVAYPVFLDIKLRTASDYGVTATVQGSPSQASLLASTTTFWGNPGDQSHNTQRLTPVEAKECNTACEAPNGERSVPPTPAFMTNPSACEEGSVGFSAASYQLPGQVFSAIAPMAPIIDCEGLPFEPSLEVEPSNHRAGAPSGLHVAVHIPQHEGPDERAASTMREARVTLPEGMTISASAAQGLEACSETQMHFHEEGDAACPDASKLGTASIVSPALSRPLRGAVYQRTPTPGHQFGLWLVSDDLGLHIKLAGEVTGDPATGQLTARFSDLPQVPVEEVALDFFGGARAPLKNPDSCGTHQASFAFRPWSNDPEVKGETSLAIDEGCGVGFSPKIAGGVTRPRAGAYSPFVFTLTREDGEDNVKRLDVELPQGELAKLKGVPLCPEAVASTGACPAASKIGSASIAAGAGPKPLWIPQPGKPQPFVYLAGPFEGAPYSIVSVVAAQAGPFDLGTVIVRSGLFIDPGTGAVTVKTELPQVLEGATVLYRTIHIDIDRPKFTLNPTDCRPMKVKADVTATHGATARPSDRFQVGGCKRLKFAPKLSLNLKGGSKRGQYPALTAVMKARKGDANIDHVSVALPHSEFLAQEHIGTICTRKRFAANDCPKNSIYGYAKAWTPLLSKPLEGPVYLRSSNHLLPDLVAALDGQIEIDLAGRIDSTKAGGIRTTFETVPDAPVTRFILRMKGGAKSLLVNSTDTCQGIHRAQVRIGAQNGRRVVARPRLEPSCKTSK